MSPIILAGLVGALCGAGIFAVWFGATHPEQSLAEVNESVQHGAGERVSAVSSLWRSELRRSRRRWSAALELCEQTSESFVRGRILLTIEFAVIPLIVWLTGAIGILPRIAGGGLWLPLTIAGAGLGWVAAAATLRREAKRRADEFNAGLAGYSELIALLVAGGAGLETAAEEAAKAGQGQVFRHLRSAIAAASARREPPWTSIARLGERLELDDLVQFGQSMALAADGAQISDALIARAEVARERDLTRQLSRAESTSETMVVPVTLMLAGVFVLIGFPIVVAMTAL